MAERPVAEAAGRDPRPDFEPREFWAASLGSQISEFQTDRSGEKDFDQFHQKGRKDMDPGFSGQTRHPKASEVTMGGGKGNVDHYVFSVKPGRVIFEMDGVSEATAERALKLAGFKLPFKTRIIKKS